VLAATIIFAAVALAISGPPAGPDVAAQWNVVTPEYFRTVGIPLRRGRGFDQRDRADSTPSRSGGMSSASGSLSGRHAAICMPWCSARGSG